MSPMLPNGKTLKGMRLRWRNGPRMATDPLSAWNGLLEARGLTERDAFFSPRLIDLPDPDGMQEMTKAAERVADAIMRRERIHVFGDFDCDGVTGTVILVEAFRSLGSEVSFSIPHRIEQGHGIDPIAMREAVQRGCTLGISVDTGTSCHEACDESRSLGMDLIVADHHLPDQDSGLPPVYALLNPSREGCGFAGGVLCGAGVAFFLLMATWKRLRGMRKKYDLRRLLDRVAVATIADVMPLSGVNRILIHHGLSRLNREPSTGLRALMHIAGVQPPVNVEKVAFSLAPRINAASRMDHGQDAAELLLCRHEGEAMRLAQRLDAFNRERRQVESRVFKAAMRDIERHGVLAAYAPDWHAGVVGLAAGKIARHYGRPAAIGYVDPGNRICISVRGVHGYHVGELLQACRSHLIKFGGHAGAGGAVLQRESWEAFRHTFSQLLNQKEKREEPAHIIDSAASLSTLHPGLVARMERFEPTGAGNPPALFFFDDLEIEARRDLKGGVSRLDVRQGGQREQAVIFRAPSWADRLRPGMRCALIGRMARDEWRGGRCMQILVEDAYVP